MIVKRLGKTLGYSLVRSKLTSLRKPESGLELMDVWNGYFMIKLNNEAKHLGIVVDGV